jgi:hypothetical protein
MERLQGRTTRRSLGFVVVLALGSSTACGGIDPAEEETLGTAQGALCKKNKDFDVDFAGCSEFAGIGVVPAANAQPFVPPGYTLAGDGTTALVVVRVAQCQSAVVDGKKVGETTTSQVGVTLQGPDLSADINNYTLLFATTEPRLHAAFQAAGVAADLSKQLSLSLKGGALSAKTSSPGWSFQLTGSSATPTTDPTTFIASWWANGKHGAVQSRTVFPKIRFGSSTTTLTTTPGSKLAALLGGTSATFVALDSYNTFPSSHLEVRAVD